MKIVKITKSWSANTKEHFLFLPNASYSEDDIVSAVEKWCESDSGGKSNGYSYNWEFVNYENLNEEDKNTFNNQLDKTIRNNDLSIKKIRLKQFKLKKFKTEIDINTLTYSNIDLIEKFKTIITEYSSGLIEKENQIAKQCVKLLLEDKIKLLSNLLDFDYRFEISDPMDRNSISNNIELLENELKNLNV